MVWSRAVGHRLRVPATHTDIHDTSYEYRSKPQAKKRAQKLQQRPVGRKSQACRLPDPGAGGEAPLPGLEGLQSRTPQAVMPCLYFQERHRLLRSIATVIGPTPRHAAGGCQGGVEPWVKRLEFWVALRQTCKLEARMVVLETVAGHCNSKSADPLLIRGSIVPKKTGAAS